MFEKILDFFGLAKKSEVETYRAVSVCLGKRLETCSGKMLDIPGKLQKVFDVRNGKMQEMHIDISDGCSDFYHRFSPGVSGYSWRSADELREWVDTDR